MRVNGAMECDGVEVYSMTEVEVLCMMENG